MVNNHDLLKGKIIKGVGGNYYVMTADGQFVCQARGLFRKEGITPLVGDFVEISVVDKNKLTGYLQRILPRLNQLARPKVANVDQVVLVCAISPPISMEILDWFLITCEKQGVPALLCVNKIDLSANDDYKDIVCAYEAAKYKVITSSVKSNIGLDELRQAMAGKTSIFAGPSGVGKSSLLNAMYPQYSLAVGELSEKIQRGKHTTRHTSLLQVDKDTFVVDSPGFTSLSIDYIDKRDLQHYYPEFAPYLGECYYVDCIHVTEHDCAVKARVGLDIDAGRYERYVRYVSGGNDK